jgi:hypothetical protein
MYTLKILGFFFCKFWSWLNFLKIDLELEVENEVASAFSNFAHKIKVD